MEKAALPITVVSGIPRSGTSLMMQMLAAGGLPTLVDDQRPPDPSNSLGYFEFDPVKRLRLDQSWLGQARGRAVKIIHLLLRELPTDGRFQYRVIIMRRPLTEVVSSQRAMLERQAKPSAECRALIDMYEKQLLEIQGWLNKQECFRCTSVEYHDVLARPLDIAREVNAFLEQDLDINAMAAPVTPALCHHRSNASVLSASAGDLPAKVNLDGP